MFFFCWPCHQDVINVANYVRYCLVGLYILFSETTPVLKSPRRAVADTGLGPYVASSPGHSQLFNVARLKTGEPGSRNHVRVTYVEGWWKDDYFAWVSLLFAHSDNWSWKLVHVSFCWTNTTRTPVSQAGNRIQRQTDSLMIPSGRFVHYKPYRLSLCA